VEILQDFAFVPPSGMTKIGKTNTPVDENI
jgi:hypothetical protein